jgi:hypothetical protein
MPMTDEQRGAMRDLLERVSHSVESNPGANAPTIRARAGVKRKDGDLALDLLLRGGFIVREQLDADVVYRSVKPYRVSNETPRAAFASTHAAQQGGG